MRENFYLIAEIKAKISPKILVLDWNDLKGQSENEIKNYYGNDQISGFDLVPQEPFKIVLEKNLKSENISLMIQRSMKGNAWTVILW